MKPIARIRSDFATKFGIPRQSGVVGSLQAEIVFEPEFRSRDAVRGLEAFSHIWLIWEFSENVRAGWSPTVRPPRLGGNVRMGVFATRSPFRPNPIGLSCVRLERIEFSDARGPVLHVAGADLMDSTPMSASRFSAGKRDSSSGGILTVSACISICPVKPSVASGWQSA